MADLAHRARRLVELSFVTIIARRVIHGAWTGDLTVAHSVGIMTIAATKTTAAIVAYFGRGAGMGSMRKPIGIDDNRAN